MDNVNITAGTGTSIATDDVSGVQYQRMKLVDGTLNGTDAIVGDAASGLFVNPKRSIARVQVTPTISTAIYATGDQLGSLMTITNAARVSGNGGVLLGITVLDKTQAQRSAMDLFFFDRSVTAAADNAIATFSDADMAFCLGEIPIGTVDYNTAFAGTPANSIASVPKWVSAAAAGRPATMAFPYALNGTDLFCAAVVRGTPTYVATTDLTFSFTVERY